MSQPDPLTIKKNNNLDQLDWLQIMYDSEKKDVSLLEGDIASKDTALSGMDQQELNTLDEPISTTLLRDLTSIVAKIKSILFPFIFKSDRQTMLKDWDLWGPLLFCTFLAYALHHDQQADQIHQTGPHFSEIFILIWFGSYIVSINFKLLAISSRKSNVVIKHLAAPSIFQLLCVFGYCLSPPCLGIFFLNLFKFILNANIFFYFKLLIGFTIAFVWPTLSCYQILFKYQEVDKRPLSLYPIALFYFAVSWIIIISH